jgi:mRNA interferase MazF
MKKLMASSEALPKQFDIVVVPFPYSDQLAEMRRPALVVSSNAFNKKHGLLWVVMITSATNAKRPDDIAISANSKTGLPAPSLIRPSKIATIEPERVARVAGRIDGKLAKATQMAISNAVS